MRKKLLITILFAVMILGLYSTVSFADEIKTAKEGTAVYNIGSYSFTPKTSGIYYYNYSYSYISQDETGEDVTKTNNVYYSFFKDYDEYYVHMLEANETYYFQVNHANTTLTIKKAASAGQMTQGNYTFNVARGNLIYYTLDTTATDYYRFISAATGGPDLFIYDATADKKHKVYSGNSFHSDVNVKFNFDGTFRLTPNKYYVCIFAYDANVNGKITVSHKGHALANVTQSNGYNEKKCKICGCVAAKNYVKPAVPSIIAKSVSKSTLTITSSKAKYAVKYQIQYSLNKSFKGAKNASTNKNSYTAKKLKKGKTYYVRVRSVNNGGVSAWSKVKKVKIKK